ncbi:MULTISPECIES: hypothetical protein [Bacillus cereus group]|uniref:hypothetical protein n=1 Tax=Bacillus cereus group TaxID=86661 RepID=UPI00242A2F8E|nr:hypothetical protein [Bacillus cereus]GMB78770.1 hypothetical protein BCER1_51710 [Bacillus cereus]
MSFKAEVLRVLIASPSDVQKERDEIETAIFEWNTRFAEEMQIILLPSRWEKGVVPAYGGTDAQQVINEQLVNKCDILIGVFWAKLGTPTTRHSSGTLEEISIFIEQNKEVMVYFVDKYVPMNANFDEIREVNTYKETYGQKGVYAPYNVNKIIDHLYQKVVNYKKKNEVVSEKDEGNNLHFTQPKEAAKEINEFFLEQIILSDKLTENEYLVLRYTLDTENRNFGFRWMEQETLQKIKAWEERKGLTTNIVNNYHGVIENLAERGIIEVKEYTSYGNPRLYTMPLSTFDQLRQLSSEAKNVINKVMVSFYTLF